ncbi:hypothetical protein TRSC58_06361 [Trypanosoma rangeli SC58]|uniref:DUF7578 domain-containing protein n=1 Tax=Trypanosoma rangeli SC58 TaxID=429131 RepID=A0A061IY49_TRYRA|nr:hypothetical protein TRSC58_06361 [Trypanosoma rangeli SC58]
MSEWCEEEFHATEEPPARRRRVEGEPQRPRWTLASSVVDVLYVRVGESDTIWLNDFLRSTLGGRGVVPMNENVSIENFVVQPRAFIQDGDVLGLILASPLFVAMEDARRLTERDVATLRDWKDFADKRIASAITRTKT